MKKASHRENPLKQMSFESFLEQDEKKSAALIQLVEKIDKN